MPSLYFCNLNHQVNELTKKIHSTSTVFVQWVQQKYCTFEKIVEDKLETILISNSQQNPIFSEPSYDLVEFEDSYCVHIEAPGVELENVKLSAPTTGNFTGGNSLSFYINKYKKVTVTPHEMLSSTREYGVLRLHLPHLAIPDSVNLQRMTIDCDKGVISIIIPKIMDQSITSFENSDSSDSSDSFEIVVERFEEFEKEKIA